MAVGLDAYLSRLSLGRTVGMFMGKARCRLMALVKARRCAVFYIGKSWVRDVALHLQNSLEVGDLFL